MHLNDLPQTTPRVPRAPFKPNILSLGPCTWILMQFEELGGMVKCPFKAYQNNWQYPSKTMSIFFLLNVG